MTADPPTRDPRRAAVRIAAACALAGAFALGVYLLLDSVRPGAGLVGFTFLLLLPAAIAAFVAYVADPWGERTIGRYLMVPVWILLAVAVLSVFVLREGVICILILSPLWLIAGMIGAGATFSVRRRLRERGRVFCAGLLALPLVAMQVEPLVPLPAADVTVTRTIVVAARPETIWPLLRGIPDVRPGEGRWNLSQDVIGVPRPLGARLVGEGVGAVRLARWDGHVSFRERVTEWVPGRRIGWRFDFGAGAGWAYTDRHLVPDSAYFRVLDGSYTLAPAGLGRTRVTLATRYRLRTPVNAYSRAWGELVLGDLEDNLLALIRQRAGEPLAGAT